MTSPDASEIKRKQTFERTPAANEFFVRGHHWMDYSRFLRTLYEAEEGSSIGQIAQENTAREAGGLKIVKAAADRNRDLLITIFVKHTELTDRILVILFLILKT